MMGMKNKENTPVGSLHNTLSAGTFVKGNIVTDTDFRLDGKVEGDVSCGSKIVIGPKAQVSGNIEADSAEVLGIVDGNLRVSGLLVLKASAVVNGDILMGTLEIEPNATFNGTCKMISETK